jgi:hypothetical protein
MRALLTENLMETGLIFKGKGAARRANKDLKSKSFICIQFNETTTYSFFLDVARGKFDARATDVDLHARVGRVLTIAKPKKDWFVSQILLKVTRVEHTTELSRRP